MVQEIVRSRAPLRIGIAGGGTDVEPYASSKGGVVFNSTINKYAYCSIRPNGTDTLTIRSLDYGSFEASVDGGPLKYDGNLDLAKAVANHFDIKEGFDMFIHSEAPPGSGLGGSSTVIVAILKAVTEWQNIVMDKHEMAALAYHLEREILGLKGGKQDQYAATFGGFNRMDFDRYGVTVRPLDVSQDTIEELQYCSLLCYTGKSRESADIIESQVKSFQDGTNEDALDAAKGLAIELSDALVKGNIPLVGELLGETWEQKKRFSNKISNHMIDAMYKTAISNGAYGGKVSGAGGGGFMYFICEYDKKHIIAKELSRWGVRVTDFMFEPNGAISWRAKQ